MIGGQTCHSRFGLPVPFIENSTSRININSREADYLRKAKVIICDEASMIPSYFLNELDNLLKDITKNFQPFGGKIIILGVDFRQTLPVTPDLLAIEKMGLCINRSNLWYLFDIITLHKNMRVNQNEIEFSNWLITLGDGMLPRYRELTEHSIRLPKECVFHSKLNNDGSLKHPNEEDLID